MTPDRWLGDDPFNYVPPARPAPDIIGASFIEALARVMQPSITGYLPKLGPHEYRCSACRGVFNKDWSDEEARAEYEAGGHAEPVEDAVVVCDGCYKKMGRPNHRAVN